MGLYLGTQRITPALRVKGDDTQGKYLVTVIDYDGTILKQDHLNTGDRMVLPPHPTHSNLTFQGWSCAQGVSYDGANYYVTVTDNDITVGAYYNTLDGRTEIDIELNTSTGLTFTFKMNGTKDWGDGTTDTATSHTYADYGQYTIKCNGTAWGSNSSTSGTFGQGQNATNYSVRHIRIGTSTTTMNYSYALQYCYGLQTISISTRTNTNIGSYFFRNCINLRALVIPEGFKTINSYNFYYLSQAQYIALPSTLTSINTYAFGYMSNLVSLPIPNGVKSLSTSVCVSCSYLRFMKIPSALTTIGSSTFSSCAALKYVKFPSTLTSIGSSAFANCRECTYDFTDCTTIPTLTAGAFNVIYPYAEIRVPASLVDSWKAANGWSSYASNIVGV